MMQDKHATYVIYTTKTDSGEIRILNLFEEESDVGFIEYTSGPDTAAIYGDTSHTQKLSLGKDAVGVLKRMLGDSALFEGLRRWSEEGRLEWLSDISDILDSACVPYTYVAYDSAGGIYRPPFDFA